MDNLKFLLTTTDGRISRQQWWIGVVAMLVIGIVLSVILGVISGSNFTLMAWLSLLINIALIYPAYCIGIKRRHDRDNDGTDLKVMLGVSVFLSLLQATGIGMSLTDIGGVVVPTPSPWFGILNLIFFIFGIYMLVQLGFLKGTTGANRFGPDPLDGIA